ncbi:MAG: hypothetical protein GXP55_17460 [Deltaproteobacteria bacterium]|nr:hypothetical protein [Deltaproteobacteria bacterium]
MPEPTALSESLSDLMRDLSVIYARELEELAKRASEVEQPGWLWGILLESWSTLGGSRGFDGLMTPANLRVLAYRRLRKLSTEERRGQAEEIFRTASVRYPAQKAGWLAQAVDLVATLGGPDKARDALLACDGGAAKTRFLRQFPGIGPKYARNIMMTIIDPDFRDSIAVDQRIMKVAAAIGLPAGRAEIERYFLDVAARAGVAGWQVDRLLYGHTDEVLAALSGRAGVARRRVVRVRELAAEIGDDLGLDDEARAALSAVLERHAGEVIG